MLDKFKDECGVFGIFGHHESANMTYLGLYALQHRGQESAGITASDGVHMRVTRGMGYVADVFDGENSPIRGLMPSAAMTLSVVHSRALLGIQAPEVVVEVHMAQGLPTFTIVGR